ncbi:MAG: tRNA 2-selenouridine(34) synthase MnmH [Parvularculaceae bacterium]
MIEDIQSTDKATLALFDAIIDVRSPSEFAEDHLPGAINLPVLNDAERAEVGTIYKQVSRFDARRIGAAYVARNVASHLQTVLAGKPAKFRPLLYCWRGGMRSNSMATILSLVGWRVGVLNGGYKTWRRAVVGALRSEEPLSLVLLDGQTGTAKSDILRRLPQAGAQTLDLEAYARHRGSVFGGFPSAPQPPQKLFESRIWEAMQSLDLSRPIVVEAESSKIGECEIPKRLWTAMLAAPRIVVTAAPKARARYLLKAYSDIASDRNAVLSAVDRLRPFHARETIAEWEALADAGALAALAEALMERHYDPAYARSRARGKSGGEIASFSLDALDAATFERVAQEIASRLGSATLKGIRP